ncbi:MAG: efflux RND transporter periplasmic adaptor subunit [Defluviitaleaceae bacterium]|nr:efflux RND transporter periplasmic adaptor subunit [Defluviitaleaceae bacterium]
MKKKAKTIIKISIFAVILGIGGFVLFQFLTTDNTPIVSHNSVRRGDLIESINIRGAVESVSRRNVHSTLNFVVDRIYVEVGDTVQEGQILAILDTGDLELNILQQRAELSATEQNSLNALQNNQRILREAQTNLNQGNNSQVLNAETSLRTAQTNLEIAQRNFEDALDDFNNPNNSQLVSARSNLAQAESAITQAESNINQVIIEIELAQIDIDQALIELEARQRTLENNRILLNAGAVSRNAFETSETDFNNAQSRLNNAQNRFNNTQNRLADAQNRLADAQNQYDDAWIALENSEVNVRRSLEAAENNLASAQLSRNNAAVSLEAAENSAGQELQRLSNQVDASRIATNNDARIISIERLERQLEDSVIRAPMSGTVTVVLAREGAMGNGLLFVIEDTENLMITTKIREFDASTVQVGMPVEIRTDSTGSSVFRGQVRHIDPTAVRNAQGDIASTTDVEFGAEIAVTSTDTPLRIGMNARLNVILDQRRDIFFVPFDSIGFDNANQTVIFVIHEEEGRYFAQALPVVTGLETDFFVEIESAELREGLAIVHDSSTVQDGMEIAISGNTSVLIFGGR